MGAAPVRERDRIEYRHADVVEGIDLGAESVEQTFRFDRLHERGAIVLTLRVSTDLVARDRGDGVGFSTEHGEIGYGEAVVFDAAGRSAHAETTYADGRRRRLPVSTGNAASITRT